jgi:hypothetical protein
MCSADYEEQVMVSGVPHQLCPRCTVPKDELQDLSKSWPNRTHESTRRTRAIKVLGEHTEAKRPYVGNFAWTHKFVNIHQVFAFDQLHEMDKGMSDHLVNWIVYLLHPKHNELRKSHTHDHERITDDMLKAEFDRRLISSPPHPGIKHFGRGYHGITQWQGDETRGLMDQFITTIAPLFHDDPTTVLYARALVNLAYITRFKAHDTYTLGYIEHYLRVMDILQPAMEDRLSPADPKRKFAFIKFHNMSHIVELVKWFGPSDNSDTSIGERLHRYLKRSAKRTNWNYTWVDQMLQHEIRRLKGLVSDDIQYNNAVAQLTAADYAEKLHVITFSRSISLVQEQLQLGQGYKDDYSSISDDDLSDEAAEYEEDTDGEDISSNVDLCTAQRVWGSKWQKAANVATALHDPEFLRALSIFVRDERLRTRKPTNQGGNNMPSYYQTNSIEGGCGNPGNVSVKIHESLSYPTLDPGNIRPFDVYIRKRARCTQQWMGSTKPRHDSMWLQEHEAGGDHLFNGRVIGELQLIFTIVDPDRRGPRGGTIQYQGVYVQVFSPIHGETYDKYSGLLTFEYLKRDPTPRRLGSRQIYGINTILTGVHMVPAGTGRFYLNNFSDIGTYNEMADPDFVNNDIKTAKDLAKRWRSRRTLADIHRAEVAIAPCERGTAEQCEGGGIAEQVQTGRKADSGQSKQRAKRKSKARKGRGE